MAVEILDKIFVIGYLLICGVVGVLVAFLLIRVKQMREEIDYLTHQIMLDHGRVLDDLQNIGTVVQIVKKNTDHKEEL